jgi:DNA-binding NarL/FixJ family response regulator
VEVLRLAARGLHNRVKHILAKLGVEDRTAAVTRALRRGIIDLED